MDCARVDISSLSHYDYVAGDGHFIIPSLAEKWIATPDLPESDPLKLTIMNDL